MCKTERCYKCQKQTNFWRCNNKDLEKGCFQDRCWTYCPSCEAEIEARKRECIASGKPLVQRPRPLPHKKK